MWADPRRASRPHSHQHNTDIHHTAPHHSPPVLLQFSREQTAAAAAGVDTAAGGDTVLGAALGARDTLAAGFADNRASQDL